MTLGKTKDGGSVVGASVFYSTPPGGSGDASSPKCTDEVERLDNELKVLAHTHACTHADMQAHTCMQASTHRHTHNKKVKKVSSYIIIYANTESDFGIVIQLP